ncbi:hypothetical protein BDZ91DRAFT_714892, partial [Kalaharituber pfeilii]
TLPAIKSYFIVIDIQCYHYTILYYTIPHHTTPYSNGYTNGYDWPMCRPNSPLVNRYNSIIISGKKVLSPGSSRTLHSKGCQGVL